MRVKELFAKDINRNIETVIKADDRDHISDEVMEYVVTREIAKKMEGPLSKPTTTTQAPMVSGSPASSVVVSPTC